MAARASNAAGRTIATRTTARAQEPITEVSQHASASTAWEKSCYNKIDYTISDDLTVYEAVQRFSAYNVGALVTTNGEGNISGVISERDYINKIALLGKTSKETCIKEIATTSHNLIVATKEDTINSVWKRCFQKTSATCHWLMKVERRSVSCPSRILLRKSYRRRTKRYLA